jgi:hypothetical protein
MRWVIYKSWYWVCHATSFAQPHLSIVTVMVRLVTESTSIHGAPWGVLCQVVKRCLNHHLEHAIGVCITWHNRSFAKLGGLVDE